MDFIFIVKLMGKMKAKGNYYIENLLYTRELDASEKKKIVLKNKYSLRKTGIHSSLG